MPTKSNGNFWSIPILVRHICGNLNFGSVSASSYFAAGSPVIFDGLYAFGLGLKGRFVNGLLFESSNLSKPVKIPLFPIWFEIQTKAGIPVNIPYLLLIELNDRLIYRS